LGKLAQIYIKIRDKRDEIRRESAQKEKELQDQLGLIEAEMNEVCKAQGASSINTPHGTIIRTVKTKYWTNDWDSLYSVVKEYDAFGVLFKAINQGNMKTFLEEHPDVLPMGLNVENEYAIVVRRKS
jgi:hypothetical protein